MDFKHSLTGHRCDLNREAIPTVFEWAPVTRDPREDRLIFRSKAIAESEQQTEHGHGKLPLAGSPIASYSSDKDMIVF